MRLLQRFLFFRRHATLDFLHILGRREGFRTDATFQQGVAHGLIVGDVFLRNGGFRGHTVLPSVEDGDFRGEILGLEDDGRGEVGQRAVVRHLPLRLHGLCGLAEQGVIALAADQCKVLVTAGLFKNNDRKFLFGGAEFFAGTDALGFQQASFNQFSPTGLDGEVGLGKSNLGLSRITILSDQIAGVAGQHEVFDFSLTPGAEVDHFGDVNKMVSGTMSRDLASRFGLGNGRVIEIAPLVIPQQML